MKKIFIFILILLALSQSISSQDKKFIHLFVIKESGLEVYSLPNKKGTPIKTLSYGTRLLIQSEEFQTEDGTRWNLIEINGVKGYILSKYLTTVLYPKEKISSGPFEGLIYTNLTDSYETLSAAAIQEGNAGKPSSFYISLMKFNKTNYIVLEKALIYVGKSAEMKMIQVMKVVEEKNRFYIFFPWDSFDLKCSLKDGTPITLTLFDYSKAKRRVVKDYHIYTHGAVRIWIFDPIEEVLKESSPQNVICSAREYNG